MLNPKRWISFLWLFWNEYFRPGCVCWYRSACNATFSHKVSLLCNLESLCKTTNGTRQATCRRQEAQKSCSDQHQELQGAGHWRQPVRTRTGASLQGKYSFYIFIFHERNQCFAPSPLSPNIWLAFLNCCVLIIENVLSTCNYEWLYYSTAVTWRRRKGMSSDKPQRTIPPAASRPKAASSNWKAAELSQSTDILQRSIHWVAALLIWLMLCCVGMSVLVKIRVGVESSPALKWDRVF